MRPRSFRSDRLKAKAEGIQGLEPGLLICFESVSVTSLPECSTFFSYQPCAEKSVHGRRVRERSGRNRGSSTSVAAACGRKGRGSSIRNELPVPRQETRRSRPRSPRVRWCRWHRRARRRASAGRSSSSGSPLERSVLVHDLLGLVPSAVGMPPEDAEAGAGRVDQDLVEAAFLVVTSRLPGRVVTIVVPSRLLFSRILPCAGIAVRARPRFPGSASAPPGALPCRRAPRRHRGPFRRAAARASGR